MIPFVASLAANGGATDDNRSGLYRRIHSHSDFIWNAQRVLGMRLTAIQTELGEVNLAVLELFKTALDANRRADLKAKPAISGGGEIRRPAHRIWS
jgi:hypothetical protein